MKQNSYVQCKIFMITKVGQVTFAKRRKGKFVNLGYYNPKPNNIKIIILFQLPKL